MISQLEPSDNLKLAMKLIKWKNDLRVTERSYTELRRILREHGKQIPSFKRTVQELERQTGQTTANNGGNAP